MGAGECGHTTLPFIRQKMFKVGAISSSSRRGPKAPPWGLKWRTCWPPALILKVCQPFSYVYKSNHCSNPLNQFRESDLRRILPIAFSLEVGSIFTWSWSIWRLRWLVHDGQVMKRIWSGKIRVYGAWDAPSRTTISHMVQEDLVREEYVVQIS